MSTRAIIAKPSGVNGNWKGRYHHWDGYPSGLGVTLITARGQHFGGDLTRMIAHLIDGERVGWSTINVENPAGPPSWSDDHDAARASGNPQSYSARGEKAKGKSGQWHTNADADAAGCEWCYVLRESGIEVFEGDYGAFGAGGGNFRRVALIPWGDAEAMARLDRG